MWRISRVSSTSFFHLVVATVVVLASLSSRGKHACDAASSDAKKLRILGVFPHAGKSHFDVFRPLMEELARRGHELTVISHFPRSNSSKSTEPLNSYRDISVLTSADDVLLNVVDLHRIRHIPLLTRLFELAVLKEYARVGCNRVMSNRRVLELIRSDEKFDLIFIENFNTDCSVGFVHRFNVPFIGFSSHEMMPWTAARMDEPEQLSTIPNIFVGMSRPLSFVDRVSNVFWTKLGQVVYDYWYEWDSQALVNQVFGSDVPRLRDIATKQSAVFLNTHYTLHGFRPHQPNVVEIGGIHIPPKVKALPRDIAKFLDDAKEGVLYFSLGSMIKTSSMPKEKLHTIVKAIGSIPRKVIWKWEDNDLPWKPDNVLVKKWLPQFDILNHPNVKCYFGHGGLLGLSESIHAAVPALLMPMYGDQFCNSAAAANRGAAIVLEYEQLTEEALKHALDELFNNTRYRDNMQKLSKAFKDRPISPMEMAVWWTEYIGRGTALEYLRSETADQPWYQRCLLDVALFFITLSLLLSYVFYRLALLVLSFLCPAKGRSRASVTRDNESKKRM